MSHIQSTSTWNTSTANAQAATYQLTVPKGPVSHEILVLSDSWPKPSSLLTDAMQSPLGTLFLIGTDVGNILRVSKKTLGYSVLFEVTDQLTAGETQRQVAQTSIDTCPSMVSHSHCSRESKNWKKKLFVSTSNFSSICIGSTRCFED